MDQKEEFVYGVLTYNQEGYVIETLNSIKYQVKKFGSNYNNKLMIYDDCSQDSTIQNINNWLHTNGKLFSRVEFCKNTVNKGTVYNFNKFMQTINTENFKIIAGDDLIAPYNIYQTCGKVDNKTIESHLFLFFNEEKFYYNEWNLIMYLYHKNKAIKSKKQPIKEIMLGNYFNTPSTIYTKALYVNSECIKYNSRFKLFEDDPSWYAMIKNNKNLKIVFDDRILIYYRQHNNNVSGNNEKKIKNNIFDEEINKLLDIYINESKCFWKYLLISKKNNGLIYQVYDQLRYFCISRRIKITKEYKQLKKYMDNEIIVASSFYKDISSI